MQTAFPSHQKKVFRSDGSQRRRIMHVDMDAYFAALEQKSNPHLKGRPVVVGSTSAKRGVVSTASYESRAFGIRSGMSSGEARRRCPQAIFIGVDPDYYISVSAELIKIFNEFSPKVEAVSVDEAFLDISGCERQFESEERLAIALKKRVMSDLGLTCSVGIAATKTLAKMASSVFKPDGLAIVGDGEVESMLYPLPVENLWGVGPVASKILHRMGVRTVGDLARSNLRELRRHMGQTGEIMGRIARGDDDSPVLPSDEQPDEKSIGHERTFPRDSQNRDFLHATLNHLSDLVASRMRRHGFRGRTVTVKIRYSDFRTFTRRSTLRTPTDAQAVIYRHTLSLFDDNWARGEEVRLLGVSMSNLERQENFTGQIELFGQSGSTRTCASIEETVDKIRDRFGSAAIYPAYSHLGAAL